MTESTWFADERDARAYLDEVGRLWSVWAIGLTLLLALDGGWRRRAQSIAGPDAGRSSREGTLRELAYGEAPLRAALGMVGASSTWLWVRRALVVVTVLAFVFVVVAIVRS